MKTNPVVHFEMPAKDKKRVAKFYSSVFGWQMTQLGSEMGNYILAGTTPVGKNQRPKNPGAINGGFFEYDPKKPGFQQPSVVISVDNLEKSMKTVKKAGGKVLDKPIDIPGIGMFVSFRDTEGNRVGMLQPSRT
jgi:predicted enzyme related to lactoylglutathione lyase